MTHEAKLARMANGIAAFFRAYPEAEAAAAIREHVVAFWPARMRRDLEAAIGRPDLGLDPLVLAAFRGEGAPEASPAHPLENGADG